MLCLSNDFPGLTALWNSILCPKPKRDDWHKHACLMGECNLWRIKTLKIYPIEQVENTRILQWQRYVKIVVGQKDNGDACKVTQLQYMDTSTLEFLDYLHPKLEDFVTHNFIAKWQDKVELSYLIIPSMPFLEVLCKCFVCALLYVCHLSYKFNLFYRWSFCTLGLLIAFTKALKIHSHYYF
jgi:hypothetical protein